MIERFPEKFHKKLVKGAKTELQANVKQNQFNDGYTQRIKVGINTEKTVQTVNFEGLTEAEFQELQAFVLPKLNFSPILFSYSKDEERQYIITSFSGTNNNNEPCKAEMTLEQDYNIYRSFE